MNFACNLSAAMRQYVKEKYPNSKADLFAVFIEHCGQMTKHIGYQSMITQYVWMYKTVYRDFRLSRLNESQIINMAHLGTGAFDEIGGEVVDTTAFVLSPNILSGYESVFAKLIEYPDEKTKAMALATKKNRYSAKQKNFSNVADYIYA